MTFKRLNNPDVPESEPLKAYHFEGPSVGGPTGPMFAVNVLCLSHETFDIGPAIMKKIADAIVDIMDSHLGLPPGVVDQIGDAKVIDIGAKRH